MIEECCLCIEQKYPLQTCKNKNCKYMVCLDCISKLKVHSKTYYVYCPYCRQVATYNTEVQNTSNLTEIVLLYFVFWCWGYILFVFLHSFSFRVSVFQHILYGSIGDGYILIFCAIGSFLNSLLTSVRFLDYA